MPSMENGVAPLSSLGFAIPNQRIELEPDFASCTVKGRTWITIAPLSKDLRHIRLNCRQHTLTHVNVDGKAATVTYQDPYRRLKPHNGLGVNQHHLIRKSVNGLTDGSNDAELVITIPKSVHIREAFPFTPAPSQDAQSLKSSFEPKRTATEVSAPESSTPKSAEDQGYYTPIKIYIEYEIKDCRDGLYFAGVRQGDARYPHVYTSNSPYSGYASCLFPCIDNPTARTVFVLQIKCPRTLGDAVTPRTVVNGGVKCPDSHIVRLTNEEKELEMTVVCSGVMTDEITKHDDPSSKLFSFSCETPVTPNHIGFAIGPFEHVNLSDFRDSGEDEMLGRNAIRVHGFCLPGRSEEVQNACMVLPKAIDFFTLNYQSYPFSSYKVCFVDDQIAEVSHTTSLSICSSRLLYPPEVLTPIDSVTRRLVHAVATQWIGIDIIPREAVDAWIIVGGSFFMTDMFLLGLCGRNEYRHRQKIAADKVFETDVQRASLYQLGPVLHVDPSEMELMELKAPLVLFILNQRLVKSSGKNGVNRILWRMILNAKTDQLPNNAISSADFLRTCEKFAHAKLDGFFNQWVYGAGCPHFQVTQRFNKKKLTVEMLIRQVQKDAEDERELNSTNFLREVKEDTHAIYAGGVQPLFTGPMTIRIHEADGTPYEHIVDIKEVQTKVEIPYNTKYKRLKRSRRQKERAAAAAGLDITADTQDDVLLYCLGDVLQSEEEVTAWKLTDWSKEDEDRMSQESYEWIRMDADFEWISKMALGQPHYMFVSQLQQDKDVVAQTESIQYLASQKPHPLISSILTRTLMDPRYFYGVRLAAIDALANCAREELDFVGFDHLEKAFQEMFCLPNSRITRANDFSDRAAYMIQCAIPQAISRIRDNSGRAPSRVKTFLTEKMKSNDNSTNEFSDSHYITTLLLCLAETLTSPSKRPQTFEFENDDDAFSVKEDPDKEPLDFALQELHRFQRVDEWLPTFKNVYTVASLESLKVLMAKEAIPRKLTEFMPFTRSGNFAEVRIKALDCLVDLDVFKQPEFLRYFVYTIEADVSPYFRAGVYQLFWKGLSTIALRKEAPTRPAERYDVSLIIENEAPATTGTDDAERFKNVTAALEALSKHIGNVDSLKLALKDALASPYFTLNEFVNLLEICESLYDPLDSFLATLKYPRYWRMQHMGQGRLRFFQSSRVRTKRIPSKGAPKKFIAPPAPNIEAKSPANPLIKPSFKQQKRRSFSSAFDHSGPPTPPLKGDSRSPGPSQIVTLNMPNKRARLAQLLPPATAPSPVIVSPIQTPSHQPPQRSLTLKLSSKNLSSSFSGQSPSAAQPINGTSPTVISQNPKPSAASPPATSAGGFPKIKLKLNRPS